MRTKKQQNDFIRSLFESEGWKRRINDQQGPIQFLGMADYITLADVIETYYELYRSNNKPMEVSFHGASVNEPTKENAAVSHNSGIGANPGEQSPPLTQLINTINKLISEHAELTVIQTMSNYKSANITRAESTVLKNSDTGGPELQHQVYQSKDSPTILQVVTKKPGELLAEGEITPEIKDYFMHLLGVTPVRVKDKEKNAWSMKGAFWHDVIELWLAGMDTKRREEILEKTKAYIGTDGNRLWTSGEEQKQFSFLGIKPDNSSKIYKEFRKDFYNFLHAMLTNQQDLTHLAFKLPKPLVVVTDPGFGYPEVKDRPFHAQDCDDWVAVNLLLQSYGGKLPEEPVTMFISSDEGPLFGRTFSLLKLVSDAFPEAELADILKIFPIIPGEILNKDMYEKFKNHPRYKSLETTSTNLINQLALNGENASLLQKASLGTLDEEERKIVNGLRSELGNWYAQSAELAAADPQTLLEEIQIPDAQKRLHEALAKQNENLKKTLNFIKKQGNPELLLLNVGATNMAETSPTNVTYTEDSLKTLAEFYKEMLAKLEGVLPQEYFEQLSTHLKTIEEAIPKARMAKEKADAASITEKTVKPPVYPTLGFHPRELEKLLATFVYMNDQLPLDLAKPQEFFLIDYKQSPYEINEFQKNAVNFLLIHDICKTQFCVPLVSLIKELLENDLIKGRNDGEQLLLQRIKDFELVSEIPVDGKHSLMGEQASQINTTFDHDDLFKLIEIIATAPVKSEDLKETNHQQMFSFVQEMYKNAVEPYNAPSLDFKIFKYAQGQCSEEDYGEITQFIKELPPLDKLKLMVFIACDAAGQLPSAHVSAAEKGSLKVSLLSENVFGRTSLWPDIQKMLKVNSMSDYLIDILGIKKNDPNQPEIAKSLAEKLSNAENILSLMRVIKGFRANQAIDEIKKTDPQQLETAWSNLSDIVDQVNNWLAKNNDPAAKALLGPGFKETDYLFECIVATVIHHLKDKKAKDGKPLDHNNIVVAYPNETLSYLAKNMTSILDTLRAHVEKIQHQDPSTSNFNFTVLKGQFLEQGLQQVRTELISKTTSETSKKEEQHLVDSQQKFFKPVLSGAVGGTTRMKKELYYIINGNRDIDVQLNQIATNLSVFLRENEKRGIPNNMKKAIDELQECIASFNEGVIDTLIQNIQKVHDIDKECAIDNKFMKLQFKSVQRCLDTAKDAIEELNRGKSTSRVI